MARLKKLFLLILLGVLIPVTVSAATLSISPANTSVGIGQTVSVSVLVSSADQAMNAASGVLAFSKDKLEVVSLSKTSSIFSLWVQEPKFSNTTGTASFEGVVLNPGFTGASGKVITVTFRGKTAGTANVSLAEASVLANDGQGTEILASSRPGTITVTGSPTEPAEVPVAGDAQATFDITSPTHPDQAKWYKNNSPEFAWKLPSGVIEDRTLISENPKGVPSVSYLPPISSKLVKDLPDGVYYFHAQARTSQGWGPIARFRVNIDGTPPKSFNINFLEGKNNFNPQPKITFETTDKASGVDYYEVKIDDGLSSRSAGATYANPYILPPQEPGTHKIEMTAFDRAGNSATEEEEFVIEGISTPQISNCQQELTIGESLKIKGKTYPNSAVDIAISQEGESITLESAKSGSSGDFAVTIAKRLMPGVYTFTTRVTDSRGARSLETSPCNITVRLHFFGDVFAFLVNYLLIILLTLLVVGLVVASGIWGWFKLLILAKTLQKEADEAETILHQSFKVLHKDLGDHIRKLHRARIGRTLTAEELDFLEQFDHDLNDAEEIITKEVKDIVAKKKRKTSSKPKIQGK